MRAFWWFLTSGSKQKDDAVPSKWWLLKCGNVELSPFGLNTFSIQQFKTDIDKTFSSFFLLQFFIFFTPNVTRLLPLKLTCYITALPNEKSNTLEYFRDIKNDGGTLLRLIAHVGSIVQTVCIQLYTSPLNVLSLLSLSSLFTLRSH